MASDRAKLAAAVLGGYVLGRTKKGGAALRFAMWATGNTGGPQTISFVKGQATSLAQNEQAKLLINQVRGPLLEGAQTAALAVLTARMTKLSKGLADRTTALTDTVSKVGETAGDTTKEVAETATDTTKDVVEGTTDAVGGLVEGVTGKKGKKDKKEADAEPEDSTVEESGEAEPEPEPEKPEAPEEPESEPEPEKEEAPAKEDANA